MASSDSSDSEHDMLAHPPPGHHQDPLDFSSPLSANELSDSSAESSEEEDDRDELMSDLPAAAVAAAAPLAKKITLRLAPIQDDRDFEDSSESDAEDELDDDDFDDRASDDADFGRAAAPPKSQKKHHPKGKHVKHSDKIAKHRKPKSDHKTVPHDVVTIPFGEPAMGYDKFLSVRTNEAGVEEVYVKFKNMSYIHCEWIPRTLIDADRLAKQRLQKFLLKPLWESQWSEEDIFNPSFKVIDRIIDDGDRDGETYYLTKWCAQTYDMSTWESSQDIEE
ncbi:choline dehydrogenase 7, partial [Podochytrium sp. JEL0797]